MGGRQGGIFGDTEDSTATGVQKAKWRDSRTEDWCLPALISLRGLSAHLPGQVRLGAGDWALEVRSQGEDWGWLCEHTQKGTSVPQLTRRESGENFGTT